MTAADPNRVRAAQRRTEAVRLVATGLTYREAAEEKLGYKNGGTVHRIVHSGLQEEQAESVGTLRQMHTDRIVMSHRRHEEQPALGGGSK